MFHPPTPLPPHTPHQHRQELDYLDGAVTTPKRPFCAIVGGSKVSSKITVIEALLDKVDKLIIGCVIWGWGDWGWWLCDLGGW
jgi:hypothetical protein